MTNHNEAVYRAAEIWVNNEGDADGLDWNINNLKEAVNEIIEERLYDLYEENDWDKEEIDAMSNIEKAEKLFDN